MQQRSRNILTMLTEQQDVDDESENAMGVRETERERALENVQLDVVYFAM